MKIADLYTIYSTHFLVDTDTRTIRKNTLFFALKGDNFNGNKFALQAIKKGAIYSVIDEKEYQSDHTILVDNVLKTLQELAKYHREQLNIPIIGLTGSNGKTTTKELINAVLSTKYSTTATIGNLNNHIGVPLTLLSMTPKTEIGIVEMGANHSKEIAFLCTLAMPDYGYITNFGKAHLEGFKTLEGVIEAKSEMYQYLERNNKTVFVNPTDETQILKTKNIKSIAFDVKNFEFLALNPFVKLQYRNNHLQSNLIGSYNYTNIAAAITIGAYFKVPLLKIITAIESYTPKNNRSQIIKTANNTIILDAYNANPTSVKAAVESFAIIEASAKTLILGDMFELGKNSLQEHQEIIDLVIQFNFKNVLLVGKIFHQTKTTFHQFITFNDVNKYISTHTIKNNYILIKGSRGMALERLLDVIS